MEFEPDRRDLSQPVLSYSEEGAIPALLIQPPPNCTVPNTGVSEHGGVQDRPRPDEEGWIKTHLSRRPQSSGQELLPSRLDQFDLQSIQTQGLSWVIQEEQFVLDLVNSQTQEWDISEQQFILAMESGSPQAAHTEAGQERTLEASNL